MKKYTSTNAKLLRLSRIAISCMLSALMLLSGCSKVEQFPELIIPTRVSFTQSAVVIAKDKVGPTTIALTLARPLERDGSVTIQLLTAGTTANSNQFSLGQAFADGKLTINLPQGTKAASFDITSLHNFDDNQTIAFKVIAATGAAVLNELQTEMVVNLRGNLWVEPTISTSVTTLPDFGSLTVNTNSASKSYTLTGANLAAAVTVTAPAHFKVSLNNTDFDNSVSTTVNNKTVTIYVRFSPSIETNLAITGNITHTVAGLPNSTVGLSGNIVYTAETPLLNENFNYGASSDFLARLSADWLAYSAAGSIPVTYITQGLTFARYAGSAIGGAVTIDHGDFSREDVSRLFASKTSGVVYTSVLVNLSKSGEGDFFFSTRDAAGGFFNRIYAKDGGGNNLIFGFGKNATVVYGATNYKYNTTYLLVTKYDFATKVSSMYVFDASFPDTEPASPTIVSLATGTSPANLTDVAIRQSDGVLSSTIDGIRVAATWRGVLGY